MAFRFMHRPGSGYGNIYTPHAGSMIIQVQRETGLANRTIVISQRQVALLRVLGSRVGIAVASVFAATWLLFAAQTIRVPLLSGRIAELERDNRRIDSLQVALSRMHGRYDQVRHLLAAAGVSASAPTAPNAAADRAAPNATPNATPGTAPNATPAGSTTPPDSTTPASTPARSSAR